MARVISQRFMGSNQRKKTLKKAMQIRPANIKDSKVLSNLILTAAESVRSSDFTSAGWALLETTNTVEAFEKRFHSTNYFALLCEIDSEPAGYLAMFDYEKVDHMFVLPRFRGLGVCRKLWEQAVEVCEKNDRGSYYWVRSSTVAEPVYEAFGFRPRGERDTSGGISFRFMELGSKSESQ